MKDLLTIFASIFFICLNIEILSASYAHDICDACQIIVDEIENEVSKVDPNKILEIEGFRVDPSGNQNRRKIPYARSETHLTDVTDTLCDNIKSKYVTTTDKETGRKRFVLSSSKDGNGINLENISFSTEDADKLKQRCDSVMEEVNDDLMDYFREEHEDPKRDFCFTTTALCHEEHTLHSTEDL